MSAILKVISLAPTQTEIIAALGREDCLAGITENCDFPESAVLGRRTFGSWYAPNLPAVIEARPDLVCTFGKHQEEMRAVLAEAGLSVYHSDPATVAESLRTFEDLGELVDCREAAVRLLKDLRSRLEEVRRRVEGLAPSERPSVFRIMNWHPLISVGPGSFQHDAIELAGGRNLMADMLDPYLVCKPALVQRWDPEAIFFCEPFVETLLRTDPEWSKVSAIRTGRIFIFDCGLTCRSGPRIVNMVEELSKALHPERWR